MKRIASLFCAFGLLAACAAPVEEEEVSEAPLVDAPDPAEQNFSSCINFCANQYYRCEDFCWRAWGDYAQCVDRCDADYYACGDWCAAYSY